jgi:hypothetical protein
MLAVPDIVVSASLAKPVLTPTTMQISVLKISAMFE